MARPGFSLDRKFKRLARALDDVQAGFGEILARGSLELLWDSAYEACEDYLGDAEDVEALAHWGGKAGSLVAALSAAGGEGRAGFIEEGGSPHWPDGKPGTFRIHDLWDHAPDYAKKRLERETEREAKGKTISDLRSEAGKKGAASTNGKSPANGKQASSNHPTNGGRLPSDKQQASAGDPAGGGHPADDVQQVAGTLAPAPAPTLAPARTPARRRAGGGRVLGPQGTIFVASVAEGLGHALIPLTTVEDVNALEMAVQSHGGAHQAREFIAATCRSRDESFDPQSVKLLLDMLLDPLPRGARA